MKEERFPMGRPVGSEREIQRLQGKCKIHLVQAEQRITSIDGPSHPVTVHNLRCTCVQPAQELAVESQTLADRFKERHRDTETAWRG